MMETRMVYDIQLDKAWNDARMHITLGEHGWVTIPLGSKYYLIAENTPQLVKTIYVAVEVDDEIDCSHVPMLTIYGKRYIAIPVADANQADAIIYIWEDAKRNNVGIVNSSRYILDRIDYNG